MSAVLAAVLLLATAPDVQRCPDRTRTVDGVRVTLTGPACNPPASMHVQWWKAGNTWGGEFNTTPDVIKLGAISNYEPRLIWLTAEGALACVRGTISPQPCHGWFDLPCARRQYILRVSDPAVAKISVARSIGRRGETGRCDMPLLEDRIPSPVRYTEGEWIVVSLLTADDRLICQRPIELDALGPTPFSDTCDVRQQKWKNLRPQRQRVTRNMEDIPKGNLPRFITLELVLSP